MRHARTCLLIATNARQEPQLITRCLQSVSGYVRVVPGLYETEEAVTKLYCLALALSDLIWPDQPY